MTRAFAPSRLQSLAFCLRQEWQDPEDGIEAVVMHWMATALAQEPTWRKPHQVTMMIPQPATAPLRRRCTLWVIPPFPPARALPMTEEERPHGFLLHSFCEVMQRGRTWNTEVTSQEMRAATVSHVDRSAECTQGWLYYSLDGLTHVNCVPMFLNGLPGKFQLLPALPTGESSDEDSGLLARREKLIAQLPVPHVFYGQLWGPAQARVLYSVYFSRRGTYNPFAERGFWLFRDGNPWEVQL